jgi:hypothetical protein
MSRDIASEMINEMHMTPQMADELQQRQMQPTYSGYQPGYQNPNMPGYRQPNMPGYGQPGMEYQPSMIPNQMQQQQMQQQQQQQGQQPRPMGPSDVSESTSSDDDNDLRKLGLNQSTFMTYLKGPLIVVFIVFMLCLSQTDVLLKNLIPALVGYKLTGAKALMGGLTYLASLFILGH